MQNDYLSNEIEIPHHEKNRFYFAPDLDFFLQGQQ